MRRASTLGAGLAVLLLWAATSNAQVVTVTADRVNLRAEPSTASRVIMTLAKGAMVEVQEQVGEWYRVKTLAAGIEGYLHGSLISAPGEPARPVPVAPPGARQPAPPAERPAAPPPVSEATPQEPPPPSMPPLVRRAVVWVNGGYQAPSRTFTDTATFDLHAEEGRFDAAYRIPDGPAVDAGLAIRLKGNVLVGGGLSRFSVTEPAAVSASLPHPFYFNRPREVSGQSDGLARTELALHAVVMWMTPVGGRFELTLSGGPTYFNVRQPLVTEVEYSDAYPYDEATFDGTLVNQQTRSALGFNVGADLTWRLSRGLGVGGGVRLSQATLDFTAESGNPLSLKVGGVQVGGGIRLRF